MEVPVLVQSKEWDLHCLRAWCWCDASKSCINLIVFRRFVKWFSIAGTWSGTHQPFQETQNFRLRFHVQQTRYQFRTRRCAVFSLEEHFPKIFFFRHSRTAEAHLHGRCINSNLRNFFSRTFRNTGTFSGTLDLYLSPAERIRVNSSSWKSILYFSKRYFFGPAPFFMDQNLGGRASCAKCQQFVKHAAGYGFEIHKGGVSKFRTFFNDGVTLQMCWQEPKNFYRNPRYLGCIHTHHVCRQESRNVLRNFEKLGLIPTWVFVSPLLFYTTVEAAGVYRTSKLRTEPTGEPCTSSSEK